MNKNGKSIPIREAITEVYGFQKDFKSVYWYWAGYLQCLKENGFITEDEWLFYNQHNANEYFDCLAKAQ